MWHWTSLQTSKLCLLQNYNLPTTYILTGLATSHTTSTSIIMIADNKWQAFLKCTSPTNWPINIFEYKWHSQGILWFYWSSIEHFCDCWLLVIRLVITLLCLLAILHCVRRLQQHRDQVVPWKCKRLKIDLQRQLFYKSIGNICIRVWRLGFETSRFRNFSIF